MSDQTEAVASPSVEISDAGPARKKLSIEVPAERVTEKLEETFHQLKHEAQIPGFRPGKAPMRLLEKRFGKDVRKEVLNQLVGEGYQSAVEENELRVLGEPDIQNFEELELPEDGPLQFDVEIEVVPEFELPDLSSLQVDKPIFEVTDEQVESEIERFAEIYGRPQAVDQSEPNDYATADIQIRDEQGNVLDERSGEQLLIPGEQRKYKGVVAGILVEDLGNTLAGKKVGETVTVEATGPSGHENEDLRDKALTIDVAITGLQRHTPLSRQELMEAAGFESEDELREAVRERLDQQNESEQQQAMSQQLVDQLLEQVEMEIPENMSAQQSKQIIQRRAMEMMQQGASQDDVTEQLAELRDASEKQAAHELKRLFVLDAVAKQLGVEVDESEVNGRITRLAMQQGQRPETMRQQLEQQGQLDQLYVQLREEKALSQLLEQVQVNEISADEWRKKREQQQQAAREEAPAEEGGEGDSPDDG